VNAPPKRISLPELIPQKQFSQTSESTSTMKKEECKICPF
jgi:hypothetical protein